MASSSQVERHVRELTRVFKTALDKHEAHYRSRAILEQICHDREFVREILRAHVGKPDAFTALSYPVISIAVESNPYYELVANCWIPLPGRETNVSTKAIHHHGTMLLTTATAFGPGYEHWVFSTPTPLDPDADLYTMDVVERRQHPFGDVAFVDAYVPHLPMYPGALTITLALWSSHQTVSWKDRVKRVPWLKRHEKALKQLAVRVQVAQRLDLKIVENFDYYPVADGFKCMKDRVEFPLGPNEDYLTNLFYLIQQTHNEALGPAVEQALDSTRVPAETRQTAKRLLRELHDGRAIEGRLSQCHFGVPHATFTEREIEGAVLMSRANPRERAAVGP